MPPDEYHDEVDNSVYTNHLARLSLLAADKASILCGQPNHKYKHVADKLCIPFDSVKNYHPEYDGYKLGKYLVCFYPTRLMFQNYYLRLLID